MDDLVIKNDLYYEKFTNVPFNGEVSGLENGSIKTGRKNGEWLSYYENGQLKEKVNFKEGKPDGLWEWYHIDGQLFIKINHKDGKYDGLSQWYYQSGQLWSVGNYKDGKRMVSGNSSMKMVL